MRELQNLIERAAVLARSPSVEIELETDEVAGESSAASGITLVDVERKHFVKVLEQTRWVIEGSGGAAALLGLTPSTLRYRMQKLGITRPDRIPKR